MDEAVATRLAWVPTVVLMRSTIGHCAVVEDGEQADGRAIGSNVRA